MQLPEFKRDTTNILAERLREKRWFIQVITGPRQVGKTTAIQQILQETGASSHYAVADLPAPPPIEWIAQQWDLARMKLRENRPVILVLDEVQKISDWSTEVKRLWDEDTRLDNNIKVVILGSSSLLIQKGLNESLAGRFEVNRMSHWSLSECKACFGWDEDKFIYFGGYPGAASLANDEKRWAQYVRDSLIETAISKDILLLNPVEKPALLRQLFVLACEYGGQILSYQKLLGQLTDAGNTTTLAHYQKLLESAFLIKGLPKWSGRALRRRASSPKWLPLNTALMTALADKGFQDSRQDPNMWGRLVETAVGAYLVNEAAKHGAEVYYWRQGNREIDYIVSKGRKMIVIEVKSGKRNLNFSGIDLFKKKYKSARIIRVGGTGIEVDRFLQIPLEDWW